MHFTSVALISMAGVLPNLPNLQVKLYFEGIVLVGGDNVNYKYDVS